MSPFRRFAVFLLVFGCRTAGPAPGPVDPSKPIDDSTVVELPGYHAETVSAPVFGGEVFVMEAGPPAAPVVVLVHGLGDNGCRDWYPILPALAARFRVISFDLPGFGRSTHGSELYSPERYTDFMQALLAPRVRGPFDLVGHSMGGALSLAYAARFPSDVKRLLLLDAAGVLHRKAYVNFAAYAGLDKVLGGLSKPVKEVGTVVGESAEAAMQPVLPGTPDPGLILQNHLLRRTLLRSAKEIAALATILENFAPAIASVQAPAWILWGSNDPVASMRTGLILQARLPAARLAVLEGAGHDPMSSRPAAVEQFLLEALASPVIAPIRRAAPPFPALPERKGRCEKAEGVRFSGDYAEIELVGCHDVVLRDVNTAALRIRDSYAVVENTRVVASEVAFEAKGSRVEVTASDFTGKVALEVTGSDLDLAGVELRGEQASVRVGGASKLIFSVSRADSPLHRRFLHDVYQFDKGTEL